MTSFFHTNDKIRFIIYSIYIDELVKEVEIKF